MTSTHSTADEAMASIASAIEAGGTDVATADEFDLDAILDDCYTWDDTRQAYVQTADVPTFWRSVERHERPAALVRAVRAAQERDAAQAALTGAGARLSAAVRDALDSGVSAQQIADALGVVRQRVYQLRDGTR